MRRRLFIAVGLVILLAFGGGVWGVTRGQAQSTYTLAVVGPMSGTSAYRGMEMRQGIDLCVRDINAAGGVNGAMIVPKYYDDQNNVDLAVQQAERILADDEAVAVLGHLFSSTSLAAGATYAEGEMPVITASATTDAVTENNDWYFRVVFENSYQANFLSNYAKQIMELENAVIIYSNDPFGESVARSFSLSFQGLGGTIPYVYEIESGGNNEDRIIDLVDELTLHRNEFDSVFVATQAEKAVPVIAALRRRGFNQPMIGPDSISNENYIRELFNQLPEERAEPGYLSDGVYAASHIIFDVAGAAGQRFSVNFFNQYDTNPSWTSATYCDAAQVAVEALRRANVTGNDSLSEIRRQVRTELAQMNNPRRAFSGVTGLIYFDADGNTTKPISIGQYIGQAFISAPYQLQPIQDVNQVDDFDELLAEGNILIVNEQYVYKTLVAYTGVDVIDVNSVDIKNQSFAMDFFLWFRYPNIGIDAENIRFLNTVNNYDLGDPINEVITDELVYRVYRVETSFRHEFDLRDYPFDQQGLAVLFRHREAEREELMYVVDQLGMENATGVELAEHMEASGALATAGPWGALSFELFPDVIQTESTLGNPMAIDSNQSLAYSRFNVVLNLSRNSFEFLIKSLLPLMIVLVLGYLSLYLPLGHGSRLSIGTSTLLTTAFFHLNLTNSLPQIGYTVALEYIFYMGYGLSALLITLEVVNLKLDNMRGGLDEEDEANTKQIATLKRNSRWLNRAGLTLYPLIVLTIIGVGFQRGYLDVSVFGFSKQPQFETVEVTLNEVDHNDVTLRLGTWQVFQDASNKYIYNLYRPDIENFSIRTEPSLVYYEALPIQVESGVAPDVLMLQPGTPDTMGIADSLLPLDDVLPNLDEQFTHETRSHYENAKGDLIALPFMAVSVGVFYNKDIFDEVGAEVPKTWEDFVEVARLVDEAGYDVFANTPHDSGFLHATLFAPLAASTLGGVDGREQLLTGEVCFDNDRMVRAFEQFQELTVYLNPVPEQLDQYDSIAHFVSGNAAMTFGGSWQISDFEKQVTEFEWGGFQVPPLEGDTPHRILQADMGMAIVKDSPLTA